MTRASGIFQSITFDGAVVSYRRLFTTAEIPVGQVAAVERDPVASRLTVVTTGNARYEIRYISGGRNTAAAIRAAINGRMS